MPQEKSEHINVGRAKEQAEFLSEFKFVLCMVSLLGRLSYELVPAHNTPDCSLSRLVQENSGVLNYHTEKPFNAFFADAVPVYYGGVDGSLFDIFNRDAFIYWDPKNPQPALEQLMALDADPVAYSAMQNAPILANGERSHVERASAHPR